jgi:hypothetical protein
MDSQELAEQVAQVSMQQLFNAGQAQSETDDSSQPPSAPDAGNEPPRRALFRRLIGQGNRPEASNPALRRRRVPGE